MSNSISLVITRRQFFMLSKVPLINKCNGIQQVGRGGPAFHNNMVFLFHSYDSREMTDLQPDRPDLWSEPSAFGDRAHFRVSSKPAVLSVTGVQRFDAGTYTCRVDFRQSPTVYHHVKLDVIGKKPNLRGFTLV